MKPAQVRELFERLQSLNPHPVTELEHASPFELLIAVILSAQATDKSVNIATRKLFPVANTPQQILALGADGLTSYVKTIGLYPGKVKNILATCQMLIERHGGSVPADREALEELPGVGRKTANVVLNSAFGMPTMPVDTHIFRVANRLGLAHGDTPRAVEDGLLKGIPARVPAQRASLAAAARPLCLQGAQARVSALPAGRPVRVQGQDAAAGRPTLPLARPKGRRRARQPLMPFFHDQGRSSLRRMYVEAWRKHRESLPVEPVEDQIIRVVSLHPEYAQCSSRDRQHSTAITPPRKARRIRSCTWGCISRSASRLQPIDRPASPPSTAHWPRDSATCTRPSTR